LTSLTCDFTKSSTLNELSNSSGSPFLTILRQRLLLFVPLMRNAQHKEGYCDGFLHHASSVSPPFAPLPMVLLFACAARIPNSFHCVRFSSTIWKKTMYSPKCKRRPRTQPGVSHRE
jgi:hypothetical protein